MGTGLKSFSRGEGRSAFQERKKRLNTASEGRQNEPGNKSTRKQNVFTSRSKEAEQGNRVGRKEEAAFATFPPSSLFLNGRRWGNPSYAQPSQQTVTSTRFGKKKCLKGGFARWGRVESRKRAAKKESWKRRPCPSPCVGLERERGHFISSTPPPLLSNFSFLRDASPGAAPRRLAKGWLGYRPGGRRGY